MGKKEIEGNRKLFSVSDNVTFMESLRENVITLKAQQKMTLRTLAEKADLSEDTLGTFLNGKAKDCNLSTVIKLAKKIGINVVERTIDRTELYTCDEAFLCGSAMEITPIISIDKMLLCDREGEVTGKLHTAYLDAVSGGIKEWVTPIY